MCVRGIVRDDRPVCGALRTESGAWYKTLMARLIYSVAASLDAFIAGPQGDYDWIPMDPDIDFVEMYRSFSRIVMGRVSWEVYQASGGSPGPQLPIMVCSRSLPEGTRDGATFVHDAAARVAELKQRDDKPIWLWGGGVLFRELAREGLVDGVQVAVVPILLGGGLPLYPPGGPRLPLRLTKQQHYPKSGIVVLDYDVVRG